MKPTAINPALLEQNSLSGRLYFLDNLRTFIILIVVLFHTAFGYAIYLSQGWFVVDQQKSLLFDIFILTASTFMMPIMFFIAGYFGIHSLVRKGQLAFWKDKFYRIVIPWFLGVIFIAPVIAYLHSLSLNLHPNYLHYWSHYFFSRDYQSYGQIHFYFLGELTLYFLMLSILYRIYKPLGKIGGEPIRNSGIFFILFGLMTGVFFFGGNLIFNDTFKNIGIITIPASRFIPYLCYFFLGVFAYKQQWFSKTEYSFKRNWWLLLGIFFWIIFMNAITIKGLLAMFCYALGNSFFSLVAALFLLAFFQRHANNTTKLLSNLSVNSYSIYFIHYLFVVFGIYVVRSLQCNVYFKYSIVGIVALLVSYLVSRFILSQIPFFGGSGKSPGAKKGVLIGNAKGSVD